jgi:signal peptidase II
MRLIKIYRSLFLTTLVIVGLDQITKELVRTFIPYGDYWSPWDWLAPYARLVHISNTGASFGLFQGQGFLFTILAIIVSIAIIVYYARVPVDDWTLRLAMGLQLAGALGNLIDRVVFGYVTDFISVGNFAVFNVADSSITVGVAVLLVGIWLQERRKKQQPTEAAPAENAPVESPGEETPKQ